MLTCQIVSDIRRGVLPPVRAQTMFRIPPGTVVFVGAPVRVFELRAAGDGTYTKSGGFVFGTGTLGLAMIAGSLAYNASANSSARRRAQQDAQVVFRHEFDGHLYVSNRGWIFHTAQGVHTWVFDAVSAMQMVQKNTLIMQGNSDRGPLTWQLTCPYAELVFALWALDQHPQHPQLMDGGWLPDAWFAHASRMGRTPALRSGRIATEAGPVTLPGQRQLDPPQR